MLSTALALQDATKEAIHDPMVMDMARDLFESRFISDDEFIGKIYQYSAMLASLTTTLTTHILLTEQEMNSMLDTIKEFDSLGKDIENGNNN